MYRVIHQNSLETLLDEQSKEEFEKINVKVGGESNKDFFAQRKERMFLVRQGTPISDIDPNELPSPRYDAKKKKIKVLPHYSEKVDDSKKNPRV